MLWAIQNNSDNWCSQVVDSETQPVGDRVAPFVEFQYINDITRYKINENGDLLCVATDDERMVSLAAQIALIKTNLGI